MLINFYEAVDKLRLNLERAQDFMEYLQKKEIFGEELVADKKFNLTKWKKLYEELILLELGY